MRTTDLDKVLEPIKQYAHKIVGLDLPNWLANNRNIALINDDGDVALFEAFTPGVVFGHFFYFSRGKKALEVSHKFLEEIFSNEYDVKIIEGLTPIGHLGARWMSKKLGFKSGGVAQTSNGPHEIFLMTREDWVSLNGKSTDGDNE